MKKRILSMVLTVLMLVSMLTAFSLPAAAAAMAYTVSPVVLIGGGNEYNIVWENNNAGLGYVTYKYDGKTYTVYDEENGVVRTDDKTHTVRIPQEHLDAAGNYTVHSATVTERDGYTIKTSDEKTWSSVFYGYSANKKKITMGFISDSHLIYPSKSKTKYDAMIASYKTVVEGFMQRPDIMVLNGDITNELIHVEEYYALFELIRLAGSNGQYPVLYIVGNHEKRGFYSKEIEKYLCYDTGEFYTYFDYGPASIFVTDIGEDKEDTNLSYTDGTDPIGVIDMERYFEEQLKYFENHPGYADDATYRFTLSHAPNYIGYSGYTVNRQSYINLFHTYGTDFHVNGHDHALKFRPAGNPLPYPQISEGGNNNNSTLRTTLLTLENGIATFKGMDDAGGQVFLNKVDCAENGSPAPKAEVEEKEEVVEQVIETPVDTTEAIPTMAGMSTATLKGAADTTANVTKPVVFDAGEYYSVVWQTTAGVKCAGYVDVSGVSKTFMDQHGGKLRTETTHSVRIPKETMSSGKSYTVKSRVVTNYNGYGGHIGNDKLTFGKYANGTAVKFNAQPGSKTSKYTILAVANKTADAAAAQNVVKAYKTVPNLVVMAGDMVANLNTEKDFGKLLEYANVVTGGGKTPVMLLRGENETKGAFAAYLPRILHNFTDVYNINRLYTTYSASKLSVIGLDTATTKPDSDKSFNGFANFDYLRKEQADWLENKIPKAFAGDYNIVFANASDLTNAVGTDLTKGFEKHKVQLVVTAGTEAKFADGGKYYSQATIGDANALLITCKDDEIAVQSVTSELADLGTVDTTNVTYEGEPTTPPIEPSDKPNVDNGNKDDDDDNVEDDDNKDDDSEDNNTNNDDDGDDDDDNSSSGSGSYVPGDDGSFDGSLFVDDVEDGWFYDYLDYDVTITDSDITLAGDVTEGDFIYVVARYAGVNANRDTASSWANAVGIFSGTLGDNVISADTANSIVKAMFAL